MVTFRGPRPWIELGPVDLHVLAPGYFVGELIAYIEHAIFEDEVYRPSAYQQPKQDKNPDGKYCCVREPSSENANKDEKHAES